MIHRSVTLLAAWFVVLGTSPLFAQPGRSPLITEIQAQRHGLTRAWFAQVQMDSGRDRIQSVVLHYNLPLEDDNKKKEKNAADDAEAPGLPQSEDNGVLAVQTKQGVLQLLDALTGKSIWTVHVGSSSKMTSTAAVSHDMVAVTSGSILYVYKREDGSLIWRKPVKSGPGIGPAISGSYIFVPTTSGVMTVYNVDEKGHPPWEYQSRGHGFVQPYVTLHGVGWGTDRGNFYVIDATKLRSRFDAIATQDEIVAKPAYIAPYFYVGSRDGYLYKIHEKQGTEAWRFSTGEPIDVAPIAVDGLIFLTTQHGGLYCIVGDTNVVQRAAVEAQRIAEERGEQVPKTDQLELQEGVEVWWTPGIVKVLAVTPTRVYGLDEFGHTRIIRRDTGQFIDTMSTAKQSLSVINPSTDRIYLGTETGLIQCLHEPAIEKPLKYLVTSEVKGSSFKIKQDKAAPDGEGLDDDEDQQDTEDLFGGGDDDSDDDVFGDSGDEEESSDDESGDDTADDSDEDSPF